jgi:hypothetical protein
MAKRKLRTDELMITKKATGKEGGPLLFVVGHF